MPAAVTVLGRAQGPPLRSCVPSKGAFLPRAKGLVRDPMQVVIFSVITCGFYTLYWMWLVGSELKGYLQNDVNPALDILLGFLTCGLWFIWIQYRYPKLCEEAQALAGIPVKEIALLCLLLCFVPFGNLFAMWLLQGELNRLWAS